MRNVFRRLRGWRSFSLMLALALMAAATLACAVPDGWLPVSPVVAALISGDNSAFCAPFTITAVSGLPLGPATISWSPLPDATGYSFIDGFGDTALAPAGASQVEMTIDTQLAQYTIDHHQSFYFTGMAFTNSADHPLCSAAKSVTFTKSEKKVVKGQSSPQPSNTPMPTPTTKPANDACKAMKFLSVIPYGPARINWAPYPHGHANEDAPYQYWYNVNIEATATDRTQIPLVDGWVQEPDTLPQSSSVTSTFAYQLPPTKRIHSYTITVTGGYASADYPDHITDGKGYIEPACSITITVLITPTATPLPPTATLLPSQPQQPQPPQSNPHPQAPGKPKPASCPPGTSGDPSKGIPCMKVPK